MKKSGPEQILSPEEVNRNFANKLTPEAKGAYLRVNEPEEADLLKRSEMETGATLLENTLTLIESVLRKRMNEKLAKRLLAELRQDGNRLAVIKQELLKNIDENQGDDKRAEVAERIVNELIKQAV